MRLRLYIIIIFTSIATIAGAQVKLGGNPVYINANAYLELGDSVGATKGLLLPRVALSASNIPFPLAAHVAGMAVYNTDSSGVSPHQVWPGIYYNDGLRWHRLVSGDNGSFLRIRDSLTIYITPYQLAVALSQKLNNSDTASMLLSYINGAGNGLMTNGKTIELGGILTHATEISGSAVNTLSVTGLPLGSSADSLVVSENGTGILKRIAGGSVTNIARVTYTAAPGQVIFAVPQPITDINKINLFRNGIRLDIVKLSATTIQLEPGVACVLNDEIRIIQQY